MKLFVNSIHLFYEKYGEGSPLILLHGNGESHRIFDRAIPILSRRFTVYALDTRGHGESDPVREFHYSDMAEDVKCFIEALKLEKPVLYGFSDGGIVGLLVASTYPGLLSRLIVSGANTEPEGLRNGWFRLFRIAYRVTRDPKIGMMLSEPDISTEALSRIEIPCVILAGSRDLIKEEHTRYIAGAIRSSSLVLLKGENHMSYVVHSEKIAKLILENIPA